ncbi:hypothetical protein ACGF5F_22975 [Streptomyces sp. NPDC047821]|uniref:hypothetical protein n=1 Tax=Streptomyces sp. NPDC047821 TaxID=3365488 RepID=UPI0037180750
MQMAFASDLDLGSVPAWFGGISVVLALIIFGRDHVKHERRHIDLVAIWWDVSYEARAPTDERVEEAAVSIVLRNAGNLPVEVPEVRFRVSSRWCIRDVDQWTRRQDGSLAEPGEPGCVPVWSVKDGVDSITGVLDTIRIPPGETVVRGPHTFNLAHLAPRSADQLHPTKGVECKILRMRVVDNAGRVWEVTPGARGRPRRIRWHTRFFRELLRRRAGGS